MKTRLLIYLSTLVLLAAALISCGGVNSDDCSAIELVITPQAGSADHAALPPNNQVRFFSGVHLPQGCVTTAQLIPTAWTTSDPVNTSISNELATNGVATCITATPQPATISGTNRSVSASATLSCR